MRSFKRIISCILAVIIMVPFVGVIRADEEQPVDDIAYAEAFIERLYVNMLGRQADEAGLNAWVNQLKTDKIDGTEAADGFYYSDEFTRISAGLTDREYAERMYITILGRQPDEQGLDQWEEVLSSGKSTREQVYKDFLNSDEWKQIVSSNDILSGHYQVGLFVDRMYGIVLDRTPDKEGRASWISNLLDGSSKAIEMGYGFFFSDEYLKLDKSDEDYVKDLYRAFMGREFDEAGLAAWCENLSNGDSRVSVLNGFALSQEFSAICDSYGITRGEAVKDNTPNGITVCIDPGHSAVMPSGTCPMGPGSSVGKPADAVGTRGAASGLMEYQLTLQVSLKLRDELESRGYNVIMTREDSSKAHDLVERATIANEGADIMVRIHADGLDNTSVTGCSAICITRNNPWNPQTYTDSRRLADCLINNYISATGIRRRGVVEEDTMAGNNWSTVPCVLFELGFMTNRSEDLKMADPSFQNDMVKGLADGVDAFFA